MATFALLAMYVIVFLCLFNHGYISYFHDNEIRVMRIYYYTESSSSNKVLSLIYAPVMMPFHFKDMTSFECDREMQDWVESGGRIFVDDVMYLRDGTIPGLRSECESDDK